MPSRERTIHDHHPPQMRLLVARNTQLPYDAAHTSDRRKGQQMAVRREVTVPGGEGRSIEANTGEYLSIVDVEGAQVADLLVLKRADPHQFVSSTHTRSAQRRWQLQVGDALVT